MMAKAVSAGGTVLKEAGGAQWGYFGYFGDPDGYLWKVASSLVTPAEGSRTRLCRLSTTLT